MISRTEAREESVGGGVVVVVVAVAAGGEVRLAGPGPAWAACCRLVTIVSALMEESCWDGIESLVVGR